MEGKIIFRDPDFVCGFEVIKRVGEARPLYTYLIRNPKDPEDKAIAKYFDFGGMAEYGISKLEVTYYISDVLHFLELGLVGTLRAKEGTTTESNQICFDYLHEKTLYEIVRDRGVMAPRDAIEICRSVALVLGEAEREGFFHLALNPRNIFLSEEGGVTIKDWVLDEQNVALFAIPQKLEHDPYYYQAPELLDMKGVNARADIYSLGLIAGFLVTGDWKVKEAMSGGVKMDAGLRSMLRDLTNEEPEERIGEWRETVDLLSRGGVYSYARAEKITDAEVERESNEEEEVAVEMGREESPQEEVDISHEEREEEAAEEQESEEVKSLEIKPEARPPAPSVIEAEVAREGKLKEGKRKRNRKTTAVVGAAIAVVLVILGAFLIARPYFQDESSYSSRSDVMLAPSFQGKSFDEAYSHASELGIACEKVEEYGAEPAGTVIGQDPAAGEEIGNDTLIMLTVSLGPEDSGQAAGETATDGTSTGGETASSDTLASPEPEPEPEPEPAPTPGSRPVVSASASPSSGPSSGVMVTLSASAYDPDGGSIVSYSWSCGGSGSHISREFAASTAPQTISVTVTVTDDEGQTASASVSIYLY